MDWVHRFKLSSVRCQFCQLVWVRPNPEARAASPESTTAGARGARQQGLREAFVIRAVACKWDRKQTTLLWSSDLYQKQHANAEEESLLSRSLLTGTHTEEGLTLPHSMENTSFLMVFRSKYERSNNKAFRRKHRALSRGSRQILKCWLHKKKVNRLDYIKSKNLYLSNASLGSEKTKQGVRWYDTCSEKTYVQNA